MLRRFPSATGPLAGALAGALVGLADGVRAAVLVGAGATALLASAVLAAAADALLGALAGALVEAIARLASWGWRSRPALPARLAAWVVAGAGAAAATAASVAAMALRNNRFLAAGLAALAATGAALAGALLAPVLARCLAAPFRARPTPATTANPTALVAIPLVLSALGLAVFLLLWKSRAPLHGRVLFVYAGRVALVAAFGPWVVASAARLRSRLPWRAAALIAAVVFGVPGALALARSWSDNLRFAPWVDIAVGAAIAAIALAIAFVIAPRLPGRALVRFAAAIGAVAIGVAVLLPVSASELARKAGAARTGLVAPLLALGREVLDFDHDGYAGFFGGGDCDDADPAVHPGAIDLPGDGVDSDCDGHDAAIATLAPAVFAPVPDSVPRDLNILFLTIDTLRADHLGCYGYARPTSPNLDALAAQGTLFDNGWAHAPSTRYSMPALATGRWPSAIDWDESIWWPRMRGMRTLAEALHDTGYFTGGMFSFSYFALADHRGFERGMDYYNADRAVLHVAVNGPMESHGSSSREMADDAIAFLDAHRAQKFFLWLHFYDPHLSYEPHPEVPSFGTSLPDLYDGEIRFTDMHVGRVLDRLRALGIDGRTAIVVTGDHGEGLGEHGITEHGFDLYAPQTKVPFIIRVPGLPAQRRRAPAGHVDLAPTLVNLARGKPEPTFLGRSLVNVLAGGEPDGTQDGRARAVFQEVSSERGKKRALVSATHHLLWNWIPDNTTECYDRRSDPGETHDLWGRAGGGGSDGECARLKRDLETLVSTLALPPGYAEKMARGLIPPGAPEPHPPIRLGADVGDQVRVIGAEIAPLEVARGGEITLTVYFESRKRLADRWRLFFHLDGPGGFRNLDHVPVDGLLPVERWRPGQRIRDVQHIAIPSATPPGTYTISVGAFRGVERLKVTPATLADGKDRLRVGTFVVK